MSARIAIIGAGISGLTLARELSGSADVTVFEKARGVGGRMSTRYADPYYFDHGTQYFTARTKEFERFLAPYKESGTIAPWEGKVITLQRGQKDTKRMWFEPHLVACPNMNSLCKKLAEGVNVQAGVEVAPLPDHANDWQLSDKNGAALGSFDWVISTAPPQQTLRLYHRYLPAQAAVSKVELQACHALMLGFDTPWTQGWMAAEVKDSPIQWISVNSSKPDRANHVTSLVVHSRNDWAQEHVDDEVPSIEAALTAEFHALTGIDPKQAAYVSTHRWRYALVKDAASEGPYIDTGSKLAATGDWSAASRIEETWACAVSLAEKIRQVI